jgi:hypothetical protein
VNQDLIGRKVTLGRGHSHAGRTGTIVGFDVVEGTPAARVQFPKPYDDEVHAWHGDYTLEPIGR